MGYFKYAGPPKVQVCQISVYWHQLLKFYEKKLVKTVLFGPGDVLL